MAVAETEAFGVGKILSESFSILFRNLLSVIVLAFLPLLLSISLSSAIMGTEVALGAKQPGFMDLNAVIGFTVNAILQLVFYGVITALLVQFAYDAKLGRGMNYRKYFTAAVQTLVPNVLIMIAFSVMMALGFLALIVPGLWVYGVFSVIVPALVIERVGFGALRRSAELTKEYRWPIVGTLIVIGIASSILNVIPVLIIGFLVNSLSSGLGILLIVLHALLYTISYGIISIGIALIYARLREIKDGVGVDNLAAVFE